MKNVKVPDFINSPYFVPEQDNWHLLPGAPDVVKEEFDKFMKEQEDNNAKGVFL